MSTYVTAMEADIEDLKKNLPIPYVMEKYGQEPVAESAGRLHYINPFRDDERPSLDVFTNDKGVQRWGDFAAEQQGSVIDLVQLFEHEPELLKVLLTTRDLYRQYLDSDWQPPKDFKGKEGGEKITPEEVQRLLDLGNPDLSQSEAAYNVVRDNPGLDPSMLEGWGIVDDNKLLIPYPNLTALRFRYPDGSKSFAKGSRHSLYYQAWEDTKPILLVEGESDTWAAHGAAQDEYFAVGIPGVGSRPEKLGADLAGRDVIICFDGDDAGRKATLTWSSYLEGMGCTVTVVPMPDGQDVAGMPTVDFRRLLTQRRSRSINTSDMMATANGYAIVREKDDKYVSNWVANPVKLLSLPSGERAYEVQVIMAGGNAVPGTRILTSADMTGTASVHRWCGKFGGSWFGGQTDHHKLRAVLEADSTFLPVEQSAEAPGLVGASIVWPGGFVGTTPGTVVEDPQRPLTQAHAYDIDKENGNPLGLVELVKMHDPSITLPILSWLAMAPLRSHYTQFPTMFITGRAGSGKTTITAKMTRLFSGVATTTALTGTTPYALTMMMGGTNAFPVWFDEYRPGARESTLEQLNQYIRDSYTGTPSIRGGMGNERAHITTVNTDQPLIISGEDFADEQSHRDRIIRINVPTAGKGILPTTPVVGDYLQWITDPGPHGAPSLVEKPPRVTSVQDQRLTERQAWNLGVIQAGYDLLVSYLNDKLPIYTLPPLDMEHLIAQAVGDNELDVVMDSLLTVYEAGSDLDAIVFEEGNVYVNTSMALSSMQKMRLQVPFKTGRALSQYLITTFDGESLVRYRSGRSVRYIRLDSSHLNL